MNWRTLGTPVSPQVAIGIAPDAVTAISLGRAGDTPTITAHAVEALPAGVVTPSLTAANVVDRARLAAALRKAFDRLGLHPHRVALALPDTVGKVSLQRFEKVPGRAEDLLQLIRFHERKAAPFRIEDAQVSYSAASPLEGGGREYLVVVARRDAVREYEAACAQAGAHAGLVDLASLNVINAVLARRSPQAGDWLLVHVTSHCATIAILRDGYPIFYRTRGEESDGNLAGLVHQTAMYYEDRLNGSGFAKVLLVGGAAGSAGMESVRRSLQDRLRVQVETPGPDAVRFAERVGVDPAAMGLFLPLVGLLTRAAR